MSSADEEAPGQGMHIDTALAILMQVHTIRDPAAGISVRFGARPDGIVPVALYVAAWQRVCDHLAEHRPPEQHQRRCVYCQGLGRYFMPRRAGPDLFSLTQVEEIQCPACQGTGMA